jgi:hypothetical protein
VIPPRNEISEERQSILAHIDSKIEGIKRREKGELGDEGAYARHCMEALRSDIEQGLDQP